jgi:cobalt/nickel transport system ATP-binding protein
MDMLDELNCGGKTVIISTHDVDLAYRWADEVILMEEGGVLRIGTGPEVFADVELIKRARLKLPIVVDIYKELVGRCVLNGIRPPRNVLELTDLLESSKDGMIFRESVGRICIFNVDKANPEDIKNILERSHISYTGAMGTNAKMISEQARIPLDFTYGVIDKCILKALIGKISLILTSGGMMDHSVKRIRAYCEESGAEIEVVKPSSLTESGANSDRRDISSQKDSTIPVEASSK